MNIDSKLMTMRHSAAHLLAHAVMELYPTTQLTIGPATEEGFFYDFLPTTNFKEEDLVAIEAKMHEIAKRNLPITQKSISKKEARELYKNNPFKLELINAIEGDEVGISMQGDFYDLCKGGHVASTGDIKHFKLNGISGSYWRADKKNQALQRISGYAFLTAADLEAFEKRIQDALMYDHRRLGKQLDLFSFHDEGPGFPFYHPKGMIVRNALISHLRKHLLAGGYHEINTPMMLTTNLWKQSGHYEHYKDNMFFSEIDEVSYAVKPMNCPGAILIYKERPRSFRELPLRMAEFGTVHRFELSGVLHGLFRVRAFTQDDAHIFCTREQVESEVQSTIKMVYDVFRPFGFNKIHVALSTRPASYMGSLELWEQATQALKNALEAQKIAYTINEGDGAFYGPKIDFRIEDSMGRTWQCSTIQADFQLTENFDLTYVASGGHKERVVMIHRTIYGSFERILGIILEHCKGALPFWLAPVQARILTITDEQQSYAFEICATLKQHNIRAEVDMSGDQISAKIKNAQLDKIPWMVVVGKKEAEKKTITLRYLDGTQEQGITLETLLKKAAE